MQWVVAGIITGNSDCAYSTAWLTALLLGLEADLGTWRGKKPWLF